MDKYNTKQCSKCKEFLPATKNYFHAHKTSKDGLRSWCKACRKNEESRETRAQRNKEWNNNNKEHVKRYRKKYYKKNKRKSYEHSIAYRNEHKDRINEDNRRKYKENPDKYRKRNNDYYKRNAEKLREWQRQWRIKNPERQKVISTRTWIKRKALIKDLPNDFTHEQWMSCVEYFENKCAYCGEDKPLAQDHFIPLTKGGEYTKNNIVPACINCNSSKSNKNFFDWYKEYNRYSKKRENKILEYLNYKNNIQQLSIL